MPPADDEWVSALVAARTNADSLVAPSVDGSLLAADGALRLASTVGMVSWTHHNTSGVWPSALASGLTGLAKLLVLMLGVANFTNGGAAVQVDHSHFTAGKPKGGVSAFLRHQLSAGASAADHLAAATGLKLDVVNQGTERDVAQGQAVAGQNV